MDFDFGQKVTESQMLGNLCDFLEKELDAAYNAYDVNRSGDNLKLITNLTDQLMASLEKKTELESTIDEAQKQLETSHNKEDRGEEAALLSDYTFLGANKYTWYTYACGFGVAVVLAIIGLSLGH